jgi:hypothetical protein
MIGLPPQIFGYKMISMKRKYCPSRYLYLDVCVNMTDKAEACGLLRGGIESIQEVTIYTLESVSLDPRSRSQGNASRLVHTLRPISRGRH